MADAPLLQLPLARLRDGTTPSAFPFLFLPLEIRNMIYEYTIFPDCCREFFVVNPKVDLSILQVNRTVSREASVTLYTTRVAVITLLPHQYYLHGRTEPVTQIFRLESNVKLTQASTIEEKPQNPASGVICPHILAKFSCIRLCLFFPATFQRAYPLMFFDPIAELKSVLEVLQDASSSQNKTANARDFLEIIVAVYPRPEDEDTETPREARIREDFVRRGITKELKEVRARRTLKIGGNFTKEGLVRFCRVTCGESDILADKD